MQFSSILGQTDSKRHLQAAIANNKISHAYIIEGAKESGKRMLADAIASTILCEKGGNDACGECVSCKQAAGNNHPDIIYVTHEKPNYISVDEIRVQVNGSVVIKPYKSNHKIYIIEEAEKMNEQAQNALLKTIEEPPEYAVFLLLTDNAQSFLPTIRSRCVNISIKPVLTDTLCNYLMNEHHIVDYQAKIAAAFSQGNVGLAVEMATSTEFARKKDMMINMARKLPIFDGGDIMATVKELSAEKDEIFEYLDLMLIWYKDVLLYKATFSQKHLIFQQELSYIQELSSSYSYKGLSDVFAAIEEARQNLRGNVTFELVMEILFQNIHDAAN